MFNNEQRLSITTPPPSEQETANSPDEDQPSQALVPVTNDDHLFEEADMIYQSSEEQAKEKEDK